MYCEVEQDHEHHQTIRNNCRLLGGGVALGLAGEARAQACPLSAGDYNNAPAYVCNVTKRSTGGTTETVSWRITFSEPVSGVDLRNFTSDHDTDMVPGSNPARYYGLGTFDEEIEEVSVTTYDYTNWWDCSASDNDCQHNEGTTPKGTDRYVGKIRLYFIGYGTNINDSHTLGGSGTPNAAGSTRPTPLVTGAGIIPNTEVSVQ